MKGIVAVDRNWGIGYQGKLLQHIPEDMKFFREMTEGKIVIMGRETFDSLPGKEPLKNRINIVLSRKSDFVSDRVILCKSLEELFEKIKQYPTDDVFVIGGQAIYAQLMPYCDEAYVTKIDNDYVADKFFVNLDELPHWEITSKSEPHFYKDIKFTFVKYVNHSVNHSLS